MSLIVQKYGGASLSSIEHIKNVAKHIIATKKKGNQVVIVVSASGNTTDILLSKAYKISSSPDKREMDMLLATGEQQSIALLAIAIKSKNHQAISFTGPQVGIITNDVHTNAKIMDLKSGRIKKELKKGNIVIVAGFQGMHANGEITTLGRGGSDLTAVALAHVLKADRCELYKDVDGIYSANPKIVRNARLLNCLTYDDVLEMACVGAEVVNSRAIAYAHEKQVPLYVGNSFENARGTLIMDNPKHMERMSMSAVVADKNQSRITIVGVPDKSGAVSKIFRFIADEGINVDMIVQDASMNGAANISFTVQKHDVRRTLRALRKIIKLVKACGVKVDNDIAKVSLVGVAMLNNPGVAASMFETLAREKINIQMITTSGIKISCIVKKRYTDKAVKALHKEFNLSALPKKKRIYD